MMDVEKLASRIEGKYIAWVVDDELVPKLIVAVFCASENIAIAEIKTCGADHSDVEEIELTGVTFFDSEAACLAHCDEQNAIADAEEAEAAAGKAAA
jgi:hypothetical protein